MPRGLSELVLIVADVPRSAAFYRDVVGLIPETGPTEEWAWFWAGAVGEAQRLAVHKGPLLFEEHSPRPPGARFGNVHFALEPRPAPPSTACGGRAWRCTGRFTFSG
jgi:catechol 2,3-dioxygenase-like lactoylglutathione lyase family enzyme